MKKPKINIHLSEEDLQDLQNGETFDWTFTTDTGQSIDVHLYQGEECEHECISKCRREGCNCDCGGEWHEQPSPRKEAEDDLFIKHTFNNK